MRDGRTVVSYLGHGPLPAQEQAIIRLLDSKCFPEDARVWGEIGWWWIAQDCESKQLHGYACLCRAFERARNTFFLARAGVLPHARGLGLQRRLIGAREHAARQLGARRIMTYTARDGIASQRNLVKSGYLPYYPTDEREVLLAGPRLAREFNWWEKEL